MGFLGNLLNLTGELVDLAVEVPMAPRSIIDQKKEIDDNFIKILKICGVNCKIKSTYFSSDANHHENGKNYIISDINMGDYGNMESYLFKRGYSKESIEYCKNKLDNLVIIKQNEDFSLRDARIQAFESALKTDSCSDERFIITVHVVNQYLHEVEADCHRIADYFDSHGNKSECNIVMGGENRYINHSETWLLVVPKGYDAKGYYYDVCDKLNIKRDDYKHKSSKLNGRIRANKKTDVTKEPEVIYDVEFIENYESALKTLECHEIQLNLEINEIGMYRPEIKSECNDLKHYFNIHGNNAKCKLIREKGGINYPKFSEIWLIKKPVGYDAKRYFDEVCKKLKITPRINKSEESSSKDSLEEKKRVKILMDKQGSKICPNCKNEIPVNAIRCRYCKTKLIKDYDRVKILMDKQGSKICPNCKNEIPVNAIRCRYCKTMIKNSPSKHNKLKVCPNCDAAMRKKVKKCAYCGYKF